MSNNVLIKELYSYKDHLLSKITSCKNSISLIDELLSSLEPFNFIKSSIEHSKSLVQQSLSLDSSKEDSEIEKVYGYVPPKSSYKKTYTKKDLQNDKQEILSCVKEIISSHQNEELTASKLCQYLENYYDVVINGGDAYPSTVLASFLKASEIKSKDYHVRNKKSNLVKVYCM